MIYFQMMQSSSISTHRPESNEPTHGTERTNGTVSGQYPGPNQKIPDNHSKA